MGEEGITNSVNIRGIGLNIVSPAVVMGVAVYRDGLFQPPILSSEPLFDMAGVEVLRGPQGTFVGSSSTGGAIFYRSQDRIQRLRRRCPAGLRQLQRHLHDRRGRPDLEHLGRAGGRQL